MGYRKWPRPIKPGRSGTIAPSREARPLPLKLDISRGSLTVAWRELRFPLTLPRMDSSWSVGFCDRLRICGNLSRLVRNLNRRRTRTLRALRGDHTGNVVLTKPDRGNFFGMVIMHIFIPTAANIPATWSHKWMAPVRFRHHSHSCWVLW